LSDNEKNLKKQLKKKADALHAELLRQQPLLKEARIPVIVLLDGWAAAGKGSLIRRIIGELDPRFFDVQTMDVRKNEDRYPFLHRYFSAIPEEGQIMFWDGAWLDELASWRLSRRVTERKYRALVRDVANFERGLRDNGYVVLKLFLDIGRMEQRERLALLLDNRDTEWRVTQRDIWQNEHYDEFHDAYKELMESTEETFPWHRLSTDGWKARVEALELLTGAIKQALEKGRTCGKPFERKLPLLPMPRLQDVPLDKYIDEDAYKEELKSLQAQLGELHNRLYRKRIPVVLCYEGWDAAGKGGNIRRLTQALDPRGYEVIPIASPEPHEKARHYLWRFWTRLPPAGHIAIFDRSWYGRVMVERLEGFCSERDWKRAYNEINEFEKLLVDSGAVVLKFWIQIDKDTQLERFTLRQNTPEKQWKITDEDWRNREKWDAYEPAIDEMLQKTSTEYAPWHIIESVDKRYARIKALRIIVHALEEALATQIRRGMED